MEAKEENLDLNGVAHDVDPDSDGVDGNSSDHLLFASSDESGGDDDYIHGLVRDRTFDYLTSWNCHRLPFFGGMFGGVSRNVLNILMKGILFVQEARLSKLPMLEVLVAFDYRRFGLEEKALEKDGYGVITQCCRTCLLRDLALACPFQDSHSRHLFQYPRS